MSKLITLAMLLGFCVGNSQVKGYAFTSTGTGSYSEITAGTQLGDSNTDNQYFVDSTVTSGGSTALGSGFSIGFNFLFNGTVYNKFGVSADGWIALGSSSESPNNINMGVQSSTFPLSSTYVQGLSNNLTPRISALGANLQAQSGASLSYQLIDQGSNQAPNRVLVIQWKNYKKQGTNGTGDSFNFQIRLYETTNEVKFAYGQFTSNAYQNARFQVGLRSENADTGNNFQNRASTSGDWGNSAPGTLFTDYILMSNVNKPAYGLVYGWKPPVCGGPKSVTVSNLTVNSASLKFDAYVPTPNSYEYVVTASSTQPSGAGIYTAVTDVDVSGLDSNTLYNVFARTKCGSEFTSWTLLGSFKTKCLDVNYLYEDFDSYSTNIIPDCWEKTGSTGIVNIVTGSQQPGSTPNKLQMQADASTGTVAYAFLPSMSNLQEGTYRLRFKAYSYSSGAVKSIDVGYFENGVFKHLSGSPVSIGSSTSQFSESTIIPGILPTGIKNLVFRNVGNSNSQTVAYIDDVIWEPNPSCGYVTSPAGNHVTHNSVSLSWNPAGSETSWQYVYGKSTVKSPYDLNVLDVPGTLPQMALGGLDSNTSYKIWIRSKCNSTSIGGWIGPVLIQTTCVPQTELFENFDQSLALPSCWKKTGTSGSVSIPNVPFPGVPSSPNILMITGNSVSEPTIVSLPPLSNTDAGTHQLRFKVMAAKAGTNIDIGYLTDIYDVNSYVYLQTVTVNAIDSYEARVINLGSAPKSNYLVLKNSGNTGGAVYLDDVVWEPIPACKDVVNFGVTFSSSKSVTLRWSSADSETDWQYAIGGTDVYNPYTLQGLPMPTVNEVGQFHTTVIAGLQASSKYKIWIRSKCGSQSYGAWIGPLIVSTPCAPVDLFSQNFDASQKLPSCWAQSGTQGFAGAGDVVSGDHPSSSPNALIMSANTIISMPAISNSSDGLHRLKFKFRGLNGGENLEVGYLKILTDPSSFISLKTFTTGVTFVQQIAELGILPRSEVLAFRSSGSIYVDDVVWEAVPSCSDISKFKILNVTDTTAKLSWTGESQQSWQYVKGTSPQDNPDDLEKIDVSGLPVADLKGLVPDTDNFVWVRSKCSEMSIGSWTGPLKVRTNCASLTSLDEKFEEGGLFPECWRQSGTQGFVKIVQSDAEPNAGYKLLLQSNSVDSPAVVALPQLSNLTDENYILKFKVKGNAPGLKLDFGYLPNVTDPSSFILEKQFNVSNVSISEIKAYALNQPALSGVLAFRQSGQVSGGIYLDDVSWAPKPNNVPGCTSNLKILTDPNCGNYANEISWDKVAEADGYLIDIGTASGEADVMSNVDLHEAMHYSFTGKYNTVYYVKVKPYNFLGAGHDCVEKMFTTNSNGCYCMSNPVSNIGLGITNVQIRGVNYVNPNVTHNDFTVLPVNVVKGADNKMSVRFNTGIYGCYANVWIDFNDDFYFDPSEMVYSGISDAVSPNVLDASFELPADMSNGKHRMRLGAVYSPSIIVPDPCYSGPYGITLDFMLNVVEAVQNDTPLGAAELKVGKDFDENAVIGSNSNASGSNHEPDPVCGNYQDADVWYTAVVPASGKLTFEAKGVSGGIATISTALYSGKPDNLKLVGCDDSQNTESGNHPKISVSGRIPGEKLFLRVWENGGDDFGAFKVSAYNDASVLQTEKFDDRGVVYFPNPVNDILNISSQEPISEIEILNILGQKVLSKKANDVNCLIDLSQMDSGIYFIKMSFVSGCRTIKIERK